MAITINSSLFPPLIKNFMPAFDMKDKECRIYFSLSDFNNESEINIAHVSLTYQSNNQNAFDRNVWKNGIKICKVQKDTTIEDDYKFYITISKDDVGSFGENVIYKVQIRFDNNNIPVDKDPGADYFANNLNSFSEWSEVCGIKSIPAPDITISGFNEKTRNGTFLSSQVVISGKYLPMSTSEIDPLEWIRILIYDNSLVEDSGKIEANIFNVDNQFYYKIKKELYTDINYTVKVTYETKNGYNRTKTYNMDIVNLISGKGSEYISNLYLNKEEARIELTLSVNNSNEFYNNLLIRRTSNLSNYEDWEDFKYINLESGINQDLIIYDYAIENGTGYKYALFEKYTDILYSEELSRTDIIYTTFENSYLVGEGKQLRISLNDKVNSNKINVGDAKTDTLSSKFPYIRRNASMYYREFQISGMISYNSDEQNTFSDKKYFNDITSIDNFESVFKAPEKNNSLYTRQDVEFYREYNFRQEVEDFLNNSNPKLFKGRGEKTCLVRLMNVSLNPEENLGRLTYSFSATAYEIDENTLERCDFYNIQSIGQYDKNFKILHKNKMSRLYGSFGTEENIISLINNKHIGQDMKKRYKYLVPTLKKIKITVFDNPYLVRINEDGTLSRVWNNVEDKYNYILGTIITVNGKDRLINNKTGVYEIDVSDLNLYSLSFKYKVSLCTIDYYFNQSSVKTIDIDKESIIGYESDKHIGRISRQFSNNESLLEDLYVKYEKIIEKDNMEEVSSNEIKISNIYEFAVSADPGTKFLVNGEEVIIGDTGYLKYALDKSNVIKSVIYIGEEECFIDVDYFISTISIKRRSN